MGERLRLIESGDRSRGPRRCSLKEREGVEVFLDDVGLRLASADEDRILARLRALRSDLIDPTIAVHNGRVIKRTGDGALVEFRSVVDAEIGYRKRKLL